MRARARGKDAEDVTVPLAIPATLAQAAAITAGVGVTLLVLLVAVPGLLVGLYFVARPLARAVGWLFRHVFGFVGREIADVLRIVGGIVTSLVLVPLVLLNVLLGRWSSAGHYGRAMEGEARAILHSLYRAVIGNPARLLLLTPLTEGLEQRIPVAFEGAPGPDRPTARQGRFDGYMIVGSLPGGGSGAKLYIAEPTAAKRTELARRLHGDVGRVVIKSFSLADGSTLPQIVRENRALPAAQKLGLILEHELAEDRFFYVTRYVPGEPLSIVAQRLHALGGGGGLPGRYLAEGVSLVADLLRTLSHYHAGGLWHKDVKPDNIIVHDGRAHLVDFGLVTPLRSTVTLTTHGTEYFRDPEMVRMALRGVKVHEVDGARFDIYAAGAVLYSVVEGGFPAHGGLSQITRRCPETVRWIVRRAMADYDKRYASAAEMLADVEAVLRAPDPFALRPADLPSVRLGAASDAEGPAQKESAPMPASAPLPPGAPYATAGSAVPPAAGVPARPALRVTNWWTGRYALAGHAAPAATPAAEPWAAAADNLGRARAQARAARDEARERYRRFRRDHPSDVNRGVVLACVVGVVVMSGWLTGRHRPRPEGTAAALETSHTPSGPTITIAPPAPGQPGPVSAAGRAAGAATRVLVVRDSLTLLPEIQTDFDARLARLTAPRFELLGLATTATATAEAVDRQTTLVAELKATVALAPQGSPDAAAAIRSWLSERPEVDAVLWIERGPAGPSLWIVDRAGDAAQRVRAALSGEEPGPEKPREPRRPRGRDRGRLDAHAEPV